MLVELVPADEQSSTRHLFRHRQFGKGIFHCLVLRAATLEAALVKADLPTKGATTLLQERYQHEFLNAARDLYTQVLLEGGTSKFHLLSRLSPPPHLKVWEPNEHGLPQSWYRPWTRQGSPAVPPNPAVHLQEEEPILRMAASSEHPSDPSKLTCLGATLLEYGWNLQNNSLSSGKNMKINLYPVRRGLRLAWADMLEAEDLMALHRKKPLTHRPALTMAHLYFDPLAGHPFLSAVLKFMYHYLVISPSLVEEMERNTSGFYKILTEEFLRNHLQPAVALALQTKRRLGKRRSWHLPACIDQKTTRLEVTCLVDGAWGCLSGSACLVYLLQRYLYMGNPRVSTFLYSSSTAMNSLRRLGHQIDSELSVIALGTKETQKAINSLKDMNVKIHRRVLISDSQTCLCLCSRPSSTLDLSTSLIVSRVQDLWDPHLENLYFAPGETFHNNVDLLKRY